MRKFILRIVFLLGMACRVVAQEPEPTPTPTPPPTEEAELSPEAQLLAALLGAFAFALTVWPFQKYVT